MDWSYIAGYFDGEGNVNNGLTARGTKTCAMAWFNTHAQSLRDMRDFMGVGTVSERANHSGFGGKKPAFELRISNKKALLHALDNMIPHLIIKRAKAEALRTHLIDHVDESRMANFGKAVAASTEQLRDWYDDGESLGDIARRLGVHHAAVLQVFRLRGIPTRDQKIATSMKQKGIPKSPETRARMLASRKAMWSDPTFVARQAELRQQNRHERSERMRAAQIARWADPAYREKMKAVRAAQYAKPETLASMAAAQRARRTREKQE